MIIPPHQLRAANHKLANNKLTYVGWIGINGPGSLLFSAKSPPASFALI